VRGNLLRMRRKPSACIARLILTRLADAGLVAAVLILSAHCAVGQASVLDGSVGVEHPEKSGVKLALQGVFEGGHVKYPRKILVQYTTTVKGVPADVVYQLATSNEHNFVLDESGLLYGCKSACELSVGGAIVQVRGGKKVTLAEFTGVVHTTYMNFVGWLVALDSAFGVSNSSRLVGLLQYSGSGFEGDTGHLRVPSNAALFRVGRDFRLAFSPVPVFPKAAKTP
jgi:hypothetical protein